MATITTTDGTRIRYKDWGKGPTVVFSHGWPLTADAWEDQMFFLASRGYRCIAHDRRGHGGSDQPWDGNDMDTFAEDLSTLLETLDLTKAVLVGHSMGGGEVARYVGRHGTKRVAGVVLVAAIPPLMLKTEAHPGGVPMEVFDGIQAFSETDHSGDLAAFDVPTLIVHGDDDQIVPIEESARRAAAIVRGSTLKVYPGAPHGFTATHKDRLNADLLAFLRA